MNRGAHTPRPSVLVDTEIRKALIAAECPLKRTELHSALNGFAGPLQLMTECLEVLVDRGKVLRLGVGDTAMYWWAERPLRVSREKFRTQVMA